MLSMLSDWEHEGMFRDDFGRKLNYTNWGPKQPDDHGYGEDMAMMEGHGQWIDTQGDHKFSTICTFIDSLDSKNSKSSTESSTEPPLGPGEWDD